MTNDELRAEVLKILGMTSSSKEKCDDAVSKVEEIARKRMALAVPDLMTDEQVDHVDELRQKGSDEKEIMDYIESLLPASYDKLLEATILDVADEIADLNK